MVEMFRITHSRSEVEHLEGRKKLALRLLELESMKLAAKARWDNPKIGTFIERMFRSQKGKEVTVGYGPHGIHAEQFIDGEWVDLPYEFVPSKLVLNGETYDG